MTSIRGVFGALLAALAVSACAAVEDSDRPTPTPAVATSPAPQVTAVQDEEPASSPSPSPSPSPEAATTAISELQFTGTDVMTGVAINGVDYAGRDVIFWFWAPWCATCQFESSAVREALPQLPDGVEIVGVSGLAVESDMQGFVETFRVGDMAHVADPEAEIWARFGVTTQPSYAFVSAEGDIRVVVGILGADGILEGAQELTS